jgi:hypothetical protein
MVAGSAAFFHTALSDLAAKIESGLPKVSSGSWSGYKESLDLLVQYDNLASMVARSNEVVLRAFLERAIAHNLKDSKTETKLPARWDLLVRVVVASGIAPDTIKGYSALNAKVESLASPASALSSSAASAPVYRSRAPAVSNVVVGDPLVSTGSSMDRAYLSLGATTSALAETFHTVLKRDDISLSDRQFNPAPIAKFILDAIVNNVSKKPDESAGDPGFVAYCKSILTLRNLYSLNPHHKIEVIKRLKFDLLEQISVSGSALHKKFGPVGLGFGAPTVPGGVTKVSQTFFDGLAELDKHIKGVDHSLATGPTR